MLLFADKNNILSSYKSRYANKGGDNIKKSTVKVNDDKGNEVELYLSKLDIYVDEYISTLTDPENIYNTMCFSGLLLYIYNHIVKHILPNTYNNDYNLLNTVFYDIYLPLCYRFNKAPTIIQFCSELTRISNSNLQDIKNGFYRRDGSKVNIDTQLIVKNWYAVCESGLASRASNDNSIGSMFVLKSKYLWNDQPKQTIAIENNTDDKTVEELALEYGNSSVPKQIDFSEYQDD